MTEIKVIRYSDELSEIWDQFVRDSTNGFFMFQRGYMDYHSDRFVDHSLLMYMDNELLAVFPANEKEKELISHGGLTYGGFIISDKIKQHTINDCFLSLITYAKRMSLKAIRYKAIPHIFHKQPAEADKYALFLNGFSIEKVEPTTVINLAKRLAMPKGRKAQISRAKREEVNVCELNTYNEYDAFLKLENEVLSTFHNVHAVHSAEEMFLLKNRFPEFIHLFGAIRHGNLIAGVIVYEYDNVIHTQYMAANDEARRIGALDLIVDTIINLYKEKKKWLDFGISSEAGGRILNEGLISQKEGFGGRTNVYETYLLRLTNI